MARKKVREYNAKKILKDHIKIIAGLDLPINVAQVKENTNFTDLLDANPWLNQVHIENKASFFGFYSPNCRVFLP